MKNILKKKFLLYILLNLTFNFLFLFFIIKRSLLLSQILFLFIFILEIVILFLINLSLFYFITKKRYNLMFIIMIGTFTLFSFLLIILSEPFSLISFILILYVMLLLLILNINKSLKIILFIIYFFIYLIFLFLRNFILDIRLTTYYILNITKIEMILIVTGLFLFYIFFLNIFFNLKTIKVKKIVINNKNSTDNNYLIEQNKILRGLLRNLLFTKYSRKKKKSYIKYDSNEFIKDMLDKIKKIKDNIILNDRSIEIYIDQIKVKNIFYGFIRMLKGVEKISFIRIYFEKSDYDNYYLIFELPSQEGLIDSIKNNFNKEKILVLLIKYYKYKINFEQKDDLVIIKTLITKEKPIFYKYKTDYKFDLFGNKYSGGVIRIYDNSIDKDISLTKNEFILLHILLKRLIKEKKDTNIKDISEGYVDKKSLQKSIFGNINNYGNRFNQMLTRLRKRIRENKIEDFFEIKNKSIRVSTSCKYYDIIIKTYR